VAQYLDLNGFRDLTIIPTTFVDDVEDVSPGWIQITLDYWARWIDSRLRKRYLTPFAAFGDTPPTPNGVQGWLARIVTIKVMIKRGVDPSDLQFELIREDYERALSEIQEASNGEDGLFDLPIRTSQDATAIGRARTRSYSEQSPYVGITKTAVDGRAQDEVGSGKKL